MKTLRIEEVHAAAHSKLGDVLINLEAYEEAVRHHKRAVELDGENRQVFSHNTCILRY